MHSRSAISHAIHASLQFTSVNVIIYLLLFEGQSPALSYVVMLPHGLMVKTSASRDGSTDSNPVAGAPS